MISGLGLHSGAPCQVRFHLADGPVRFRRNQQEIPALLEHVAGTTRCTTLGRNGCRVALVEHLLAALHVLGWWHGLVIEVSADELPILDGSAEPWLEALHTLGAPPAPPAAWHVAEPFSMFLGDSFVRVAPGAPELDVRIDFSHPAVGQQSWRGTPERYAEVLDARTFGFLHELEMLRSHGLATAAGLENAIVYGSEGPLQPLRYPDEPVRHKALDALGDLFLLGRPLVGKLDVQRGSHQAHIEFMRELLQNPPDTFVKEPDA